MGRARSLLAIGFGVLALSGCGRKETPSPQPASDSKTAISAPGVIPTDGPTLKAIRARGRLICGVAADMPGFATKDVFGQWRGFDVELCRAVATAVFGDARQVRFVPLTVRQRFSALQAGQVDMLARGGLSFTRDVGLGLDFTGVAFYDTQGLLVRKALANKTADEIGSMRICVQAGTAQELNLAEHYRDAKVKLRRVVADTEADTVKAYEDGQCDALTDDKAALAAVRSQLRSPDQHVILADDIGKDAKGPVVRQADGQWADVVRWTLDAMILAEELGVTSRNVAEARQAPPSPEAQRLLEGDGLGRMLLLRDDWAFQIIRQVGNYGEVFDHTLGQDSSIKLDRGQNALWNAEKPGLLYAPPMR